MRPPPPPPPARPAGWAVQPKAPHAAAPRRPAPAPPGRGVIQRARTLADVLKDRPKAPNTIKNAKPKGTGRTYTAHHKADFATIRDELEEALKTGDLQALRAMGTAAKVPNATQAIVEGVASRGGAIATSAEEKAVGEFYRLVSWMPWDVFIGPLSEERKDDPTKTGRRIDMHFTRSGHSTPRSELARDIDLIGFKRLDLAELSRRLVDLARTSSLDASGYVTAEWQGAGTHTTGAGKVIPQYIQSNDPYNWAGPHAEIVFPKQGEVLKSDTYSIRIHCNRQTNNVEVKIERKGTSGSWAPARQTSDGTWWFDWSGIAGGTYEIMARAWSATGQDFVSRHVSVSR
jgi:hypothetical protein